MNKNYRTISLVQVDAKLDNIFTAYFQLLKNQFEHQWLLNTNNSNSHVILVDQDFCGVVSKCTKVKIVLCRDINDFARCTHPNKVQTFCLTYPFTSFQIIALLNKISKNNIMAKSLNHTSRQSVFKNFIPSVFSKLTNLIPRKTRSITNKKTRSIANKNSRSITNKNSRGIKEELLARKNIDTSKRFKVVLLGRPGSGKTTAIKAVNDKTMLTSEVTATDTVGLLKTQTTIGIDFNECIVNGGIKLQLYGTPGQKRYDYVQAQTIVNADIYIILIDLSSESTYSEFIYYKNIIDTYGNLDALNVVVFTHYDIKKISMRQLSKEIKRKCSYEILTERIDVRDQFQVKKLLTKLARLKSISNEDDLIV